MWSQCRNGLWTVKLCSDELYLRAAISATRSSHYRLTDYHGGRTSRSEWWSSGPIDTTLALGMPQGGREGAKKLISWSGSCVPALPAIGFLAQKWSTTANRNNRPSITLCDIFLLPAKPLLLERPPPPLPRCCEFPAGLWAGVFKDGCFRKCAAMSRRR